MSDIAIRVENLGKRYQIGQRNSHRTLRATLSNAFTAPFRRSAMQPASQEVIWALRDISLEIERGQAIGIVGRNGSGKSTLLNILSRITKPTIGYAEVSGRVGSLLEVGTGFNPELSGRENTYLNGSILGMKRAEIVRKFDEIVDFSGVEKFIDTPVKHYSSGMYMRLAFSVAAHLQSDILLVDEALSVGDFQFQQKCLQKMRSLKHEGRTVVFVSHDPFAVATLCEHCFLLDQGKLIASGPAHKLVEQYLVDHVAAPARVVDLCNYHGRQSGMTPIMRSVELHTDRNNNQDDLSVHFGDQLSITVAFTTDRPYINPVLGITIKNWLDINILGVNNRLFKAYPTNTESVQEGRITCHLGACPLTEGRYSVDLWFGDGDIDYDIITNAISFDVVLPNNVYGGDFKPDAGMGVIVWPVQWEFEVR
jgi:lipopolysaccharide transport system ATP-binding protein